MTSIGQISGGSVACLEYVDVFENLDTGSDSVKKKIALTFLDFYSQDTRSNTPPPSCQSY